MFDPFCKSLPPQVGGFLLPAKNMMHLEHTTPVMDATELKIGQDVLMASGRAARVHELKAASVMFKYLGTHTPDNYIDVPRNKIHEWVRI